MADAKSKRWQELADVKRELAKETGFSEQAVIYRSRCRMIQPRFW